MNTTQAANCCGQAKQQYSRAFLISRFALIQYKQTANAASRNKGNNLAIQDSPNSLTKINIGTQMANFAEEQLNLEVF